MYSRCQSQKKGAASQHDVHGIPYLIPVHLFIRLTGHRSTNLKIDAVNDMLDCEAG